MSDPAFHVQQDQQQRTMWDDATLMRVTTALDAQDKNTLKQIFVPLHPADIADLIEQLSSGEQQSLFQQIGSALPAELYSYLHPEVRHSILIDQHPQDIARIINALESDDAIDLLEDLEEESQNQILRYLPNNERLLYEQSLSYPDDSAGRLMRREAVLIPHYWTVGQTIDHLRQSNEHVPTDFYNLIVVGRDHQPIGNIPLSRLIKNKRQMPVVRLTGGKLHTVSVEEDQEVVSKLFRQYGLAELPVIDHSGRLVGVITLDDVLEVVDEEGEQDLLALGGIRRDDFFDDLYKTLWARMPWLMVNLCTAVLASLVIFAFEDTLSQIIALAILMPITASMGGNAGTQTLTVAVRALATDQLTSANAIRAVSKEATVGLLSGAIFAVIVGGLTCLWYQDMLLGLAMAMAMVLAMLIAGLAGILVPLVLSWTKIDPAIASGVFLTTITDVVGFGAFLLLASWVLL